jgi:hypothetical protein
MQDEPAPSEARIEPKQLLSDRVTSNRGTDMHHRAPSHARTAVGPFELMAITRSGLLPRLLAQALVRRHGHAEAASSLAPSMTTPIISLKR